MGLCFSLPELELISEAPVEMPGVSGGVPWRAVIDFVVMGHGSGYIEQYLSSIRRICTTSTPFIDQSGLLAALLWAALGKQYLCLSEKVAQSCCPVVSKRVDSWEFLAWVCIRNDKNIKNPFPITVKPHFFSVLSCEGSLLCSSSTESYSHKPKAWKCPPLFHPFPNPTLIPLGPLLLLRPSSRDVSLGVRQGQILWRNTEPLRGGVKTAALYSLCDSTVNERSAHWRDLRLQRRSVGVVSLLPELHCAADLSRFSAEPRQKKITETSSS